MKRRPPELLQPSESHRTTSHCVTPAHSLSRSPRAEKRDKVSGDSKSPPCPPSCAPAIDLFCLSGLGRSLVWWPSSCRNPPTRTTPFSPQGATPAPLPLRWHEHLYVLSYGKPGWRPLCQAPCENYQDRAISKLPVGVKGPSRRQSAQAGLREENRWSDWRNGWRSWTYRGKA